MLLKEYKQELTGGRDVSLFGAFARDQRLRFMLQILGDEDVRAVEMVIHGDGWNTGVSEYRRLPFVRGAADIFEREVDFEELSRLSGGEGLLYYHYAVETDGGTMHFGGENPTELSLLGADFAGERQLLLTRPGYRTSQGFREGIVYHIFVDRFRSSGRCPVKAGAEINRDWTEGIPQYGEYPGADVKNNVFFGGDLWGVVEKLDYIASLGTRTIYLSPVFDAYSNHKYDTGDYLTVDAMFGGDEALCFLCQSAMERGITVLLDGVFNHTGSDSLYFNRDGHYPTLGAYQSEHSLYAPWYSFGNFPEEYECWWGIKILPRVDSRNPDFRSFICDRVVRKWMDVGIGGWRLDVADELSDEFLDDFRCAVKKNGDDAVIIGEVWEDASDKVSYGRRRRYLEGAQLDSVMNYPLRSGLISYVMTGEAESLRQATEGAYRRYPKASSDTLLNFLGTHDTERILTVLSGVPWEGCSNAELSVMRMTVEERKVAMQRLKLAYGILVGLPGVPCVFYGDEAGLEGHRDPFCRRPFPWHNREESLTEWYRKLGSIRKDHPVFRDGLFYLLSLTENHILYLRTPWEGDGESVLVAASRRGELPLTFPQPFRHLTGSSEESDRYTVMENEAAYFAVPHGVTIRAEDLLKSE